MNSKCFKIWAKKIQITIEDGALTFGLPVEGDNFIMNKTYTLKDRGFVKHYFRSEEYHKNLNWRCFEWSLGGKKKIWIRPHKRWVAEAAGGN